MLGAGAISGTHTYPEKGVPPTHHINVCHGSILMRVLSTPGDSYSAAHGTPIEVDGDSHACTATFPFAVAQTRMEEVKGTGPSGGINVLSIWHKCLR